MTQRRARRARELAADDPQHRTVDAARDRGAPGGRRATRRARRARTRTAGRSSAGRRCPAGEELITVRACDATGSWLTERVRRRSPAPVAAAAGSARRTSAAAEAASRLRAGQRSAAAAGRAQRRRRLRLQEGALRRSPSTRSPASACTGSVAANRGHTGGDAGLLAITDRRLVFAAGDGSGTSGRSHASLGPSSTTAMLGGKLELHLTDGSTHTIAFLLDRSAPAEFARLLDEAVGRTSGTPSPRRGAAARRGPAAHERRARTAHRARPRDAHADVHDGHGPGHARARRTRSSSTRTCRTAKGSRSTLSDGDRSLAGATPGRAQRQRAGDQGHDARRRRSGRLQRASGLAAVQIGERAAT